MTTATTENVTILDLLAGRVEFVPVRECSICGVYIGYTFLFEDDTSIAFQTSCGCSSGYNCRPISPAELAELVKVALDVKEGG